MLAVWIVIESDALNGERIVVTKSNETSAARAANPGLTVYGREEVDVLINVRPSPEQVAAIHNVKKVFVGKILDVGFWGRKALAEAKRS